MWILFFWSPVKKRYRMKVYKTQKGFDYYGTRITMPDEVFRYYFEIHYGWMTCYYNSHGVSMDIHEREEFEIYPGYHTPEWAKGAVMYQIFVDRFRNGDPSNDVETGEYFYINGQTERVEDWSKTPAVMGVGSFTEEISRVLRINWIISRIWAWKSFI